ncbi:MAG: flagellar basal body P-ring formation chaperone FlgA [Pseudomonadota bacterium]
MQRNTKILLLISSLLIASASSMLYAQEYHPIADISDVASNYIIKHIPQEYTIESLESAKIDSRIKLKKCQQALIAEVSGNFKVNKHFTIGVRCQKPRWSYYVSFKAVITAPVVIATTTILRGEYIIPEMLTLVNQTISGQHRRYFKRISDVAGKQAKRTIKTTKAITASQLQIHYLVKRKQQVMIVAKNSRLMVKMKGIALSNGKQNQRIKVRNTNSNKIIEGVVSAAGVVVVNF